MWSAQPPSPLSSGRPDSPLLGLEVQTPLVLGLGRIFPPEYHRAAANLLSPPPGAGAGAQPSLCLFCVWGSFSFPALGSLRVQSTGQLYGIAFSVLWGFLFFFLISFASLFRVHLTIVYIWLLGWPQAKLGGHVWGWGGT